LAVACGSSRNSQLPDGAASPKFNLGSEEIAKDLRAKAVEDN